MENKRNKLNALIAKKGMTKADLAKKLNISYDTLFRRFRNDCDFSIAEIEILMSIFGSAEVYDALFVR